MGNYDLFKSVKDIILGNFSYAFKEQSFRDFTSIYYSELKKKFDEFDFKNLINDLNLIRSKIEKNQISKNLILFENEVINDYISYRANCLIDDKKFNYYKNNYYDDPYYKFILTTSAYNLSKEILNDEHKLNKRKIDLIEDHYLIYIKENKSFRSEIVQKINFFRGMFFYKGINGYEQNEGEALFYLKKCHSFYCDDVKRIVTLLEEKKQYIEKERIKQKEIIYKIENEKVKKRNAENIKKNKLFLKELSQRKQNDISEKETSNSAGIIHRLNELKKDNENKKELVETQKIQNDLYSFSSCFNQVKEEELLNEIVSKNRSELFDANYKNIPIENKYLSKLKKEMEQYAPNHIVKFYHLTTFENAESIVKNATFFSREKAFYFGLMKYNSFEKCEMSQNVMIGDKNKETKNQVRFAINPFCPMLYDLSKNIIKCNKTPIIFAFDFDNIYKIKNHVTLCPYNSHFLTYLSGYSISIWRDDIESKNRDIFDFKRIYETSYESYLYVNDKTKISKYRNSEILIENFLPLSLITDIYFKSSDNMCDFLDKLNYDEREAIRRICKVKSELFTK